MCMCVYKYVGIYVCIDIGVTRSILLRHFCYLLRPALGDDATKVMVPSETKQPESLRDARDLWSVVTTTFYYFLSSALCFEHTRARAQREGRKVEARLSGDEGDDKREIPGGYSTSPERSKLDNT